VRVLFLHQFDLNLAGGSGIYLRSLSRALAGLGHRVEVVSARRPDQYGCTTYQLPFDVTLTFGPEKRAGERTLDELSTAELQAWAARAVEAIEAEAFRQGAPDLILANHINLMARVGWRLGKKFGVPCRIISYGTDTPLLLREERYRDLFVEAACQADRIFAISAYVAREVAATVPGGRVEVLGGAVDDELFYLPERLPDATRRIAYVGRLVTEKGIGTLLAAFEKQTAATALTLMGEGPLLGPLETWLRDSPLRDRVTLMGYVPPNRLRDLLLGAALLIVPSTWQEPLGLVVLEAMACGVPVVASAVGGIPEMIQHGVTGSLVPPGDPDALAAAIDRLLGDPHRYREMRQLLRRTTVPTYRDLARRVVGEAD
jgi:glycosyltransferase involved in cell wall biosynthesis